MIPASAHADRRAGSVSASWALTLAVVGALTAARVLLLFHSRLELYPDEAQYWLWSRTPAFGYFSKPPLIAWMIGLTTAFGGDGEAWVRLSAPLLHGGAALAIARAARRFYDARTGFWAALLYALMPGVQVSSEVIATDAPLLAGLGLALWALGALWTAPRPSGGRAAAALGAALGLAFLSKYAALYMPVGLAVHAVLSRKGRTRLWTRRRLALAALAFAATAAPNLVWNAAHHFQTVAHTVADANLGDSGRDERQGFDFRGPAGFLLGQLGVFGPAPFLALVAIAWTVARRPREADPADRLLLLLTAPAILIVLGEAALVRANANWAAAAYAGGAPLVAATLVRGGRRLRATLLVGMGVQAAAAAAVAAAAVSPAAAHALGADNSLKRARGWRAAAALAEAHVASAARGGRVSALAVDDRFLFNALGYYGRGWLRGPGAPPLRMWVHEARPHNQAEATAPLTPGALGARVAFVSSTYPDESRWDFRRVEDVRTVAVRLDARHARPLLTFVGDGFTPRPRDPRTGLPVPPR